MNRESAGDQWTLRWVYAYVKSHQSFLCSFTKVWGIDDQWWFRGVCAYVQYHQSYLCSSTKGMRYISDRWTFSWFCSYVQFHHSFHCSSTNGIRYRWPVMVQISLKVTRADSGVSVHTCSLTRVISIHLQTVRYRWPANVLMSMCINAVSLSHHCSSTNAMRYRWPASFRWVCAYVQFHHSHLCASIDAMRHRWTYNVQMSQCICAVSPDPLLLIYEWYEV